MGGGDGSEGPCEPDGPADSFAVAPVNALPPHPDSTGIEPIVQKALVRKRRRGRSGTAGSVGVDSVDKGHADKSAVGRKSVFVVEGGRFIHRISTA